MQLAPSPNAVQLRDRPQITPTVGVFWAVVGRVGVGGLVKAIGHPFGRVPNEIGHVCGRVFGHVGLRG